MDEEVGVERESAVEEPRLDERDVEVGRVRGDREVEARLLAAAAERGPVEEVEVRLRDLEHPDEVVDGRESRAEHDRAGALLVDVEEEVRPALVRGGVVDAHVLEVAEVQEALARALGGDGVVGLAGAHDRLAADDLVLRDRVAADVDGAELHERPLFDVEDEVEDVRVRGRRRGRERDARGGVPAGGEVVAHRGPRLLHRGGAGDVARAQRDVAPHVRLGEERDALEGDRADAVDRPLHDVVGDLHAPPVALLARRGDRRVEVAGVEVLAAGVGPGGVEVHVGEARVVDPRLRVVPVVQLRVAAERLLGDRLRAGEGEEVHPVLRPLLDVEDRVGRAGVVRHRLEAGRHFRVEEAALAVEGAELRGGAAEHVVVHEVARLEVERLHRGGAADVVAAVERRLRGERAARENRVDEIHAAGAGGLDGRGDVGEAAGVEQRADVLVDDGAVERLAGLGAEVGADDGFVERCAPLRAQEDSRDLGRVGRGPRGGDEGGECERQGEKGGGKSHGGRA